MSACLNAKDTWLDFINAHVCTLLENQRVKKWNRIFKSAEDWFDFSSPENGLSASQRAVKICSMTAASNVALVGGAAGEIAVLSLLERHLLHWVMLSDNALNIINHMCSFHDQKSILISSNDGISRALDLTSMKISSSHTLPWAINVRRTLVHSLMHTTCCLILGWILVLCLASRWSSVLCCRRWSSSHFVWHESGWLLCFFDRSFGSFFRCSILAQWCPSGYRQPRPDIQVHGRENEPSLSCSLFFSFSHSHPSSTLCPGLLFQLALSYLLGSTIYETCPRVLSVFLPNWALFEAWLSIQMVIFWLPPSQMTMWVCMMSLPIFKNDKRSTFLASAFPCSPYMHTYM